MKSGKTLGKKGEDSYIFTTIFRKDDVFQKFLDDNIIERENFFKFKDITDEEFGEFRNLKNATTLGDYEEFLAYIKKHNLK